MTEERNKEKKHSIIPRLWMIKLKEGVDSLNIERGVNYMEIQYHTRRRIQTNTV